ncbi:uncharacterized protein LOC119078176 [Bradysia coprophila]|uniref:uncharacterized protein LOC119078176 n=1 Tax=Bradysia coprophila TaxID=38358 RepID=UPI00187DB773|nr:uncharacterized protein LOC119078176 [Bradysia coprophila]
MWKLVVVFVALVAIVSGYPYPKLYQHVRADNPSHRGNQYYEKPPVERRRSSFGGSSFHGGAATVELNPMHQPRIQNYSVRVGQGLGAHRGEYFDKKAPYPTQKYRYYEN